MQINPENERIRAAWIDELEDEYAPRTIDQKLKALDAFEQTTSFASFTTLTREQAKTFVIDITARNISSATRASYVNHVKGFFEWMVMSERLKGKTSPATHQSVTSDTQRTTSCNITKTGEMRHRHANY